MEIQLSERNREILKILIADYIATALPVGSRTIARKYPARLSPATIRNVMSDLTDMGLLTQPHASAGRIPTGKGFRYYVDCLLERRELSDEEMEAIRERCAGDERSIGSILQRTSRMLAQVSRYVGLVAAPKASNIRFKSIEFLPLPPRKVLGILVSQEGIVENRLLEVGEEMTYAELEKISNYCNQAFIGLSIEEARAKVEAELAAAKDEYDRLLKRAMLLSKEVLGSVEGGEVLVEGEVQLLSQPEFAEAESFRRLVEALEEKSRVLDVLDRCRDAQGVKIFIGADAEIDGVDRISIVSAPYFKDGKVAGTVGVIGPMRMDYSRVVPIVDFTAKVLGDILES